MNEVANLLQWQERQYQKDLSELKLISPDPIQLVDRTQYPDENSSGVWAKDVHVTGYSVIEGSSGKSGASYIVWTIKIDTLRVGTTSRPLLSSVPSSGQVPTRGSTSTPPPSTDSIVSGGTVIIRKRYSEFAELKSQLQFAFPKRRNEIPNLPPKSVVSKFRDEFLESRRKGLQYFLLCILLNPLFSGSPIVKQFVMKGNRSGY